MYIIKVDNHGNDSEYLIFNDKDDIKEFVADKIICDNTEYSLGDYMYVLRELYDANDIYNICKNNIVNSEFGVNKYEIIKNFKDINKNRKYFKKVPFNYDYKIIVNIYTSESEDTDDFSESSENNNFDNNENDDFLEDENKDEIE